MRAMTVIDQARPSHTVRPPANWLKAYRSGALAALGIALFLVAWHLGHLAIGRSLPPPHEVALAAVTNFFDSPYFVSIGLPAGGYSFHLLSTTSTVLAGVLLGGLVGTATGFASGRYHAIRQVFDPIVAILGTVPILVAAPFFLIWFGPAGMSKTILVAFYSGLVLHIYAMRAIEHVHPSFVEYAQTLGASPNRVFGQVLFPASLPEIFGGLRTALGAAWGLAAVTELLGSTYGIGRVIIATWSMYDITSMMAGLVWLSLIAIVLDACLLVIRRHVTRWAAVQGDN